MGRQYPIRASGGPPPNRRAVPCMSQRERAEIWRRHGSGESLRSISRGTRRDMGTLRRLIASTGGRQPRELRRSTLRLSLAEREEISRGSSPVIRVGRSRDGSGGRHRRSLARSLATAVETCRATKPDPIKRPFVHSDDGGRQAWDERRHGRELAPGADRRGALARAFDAAAWRCNSRHIRGAPRAGAAHSTE